MNPTLAGQVGQFVGLISFNNSNTITIIEILLVIIVVIILNMGEITALNKFVKKTRLNISFPPEFQFHQ